MNHNILLSLITHLSLETLNSIIYFITIQTKYYTEDSPSVLQNFQDLEEKRIKCIKNFIVKSVEVEKEVVPIISQCLDCMEKSADSIDEKEVNLY